LWLFAEVNAFAAQAWIGLAQRLALTIAGLRLKVGEQGGRGCDPALVPLIVQSYGRLGRIMQDFSALVARLATGWRPRRFVARAKRLGVAQAMVAARAARLPMRLGWLMQLAPGTMQLGGQVRAVMEDPDLVDLLATVPGAARILRPLCRMLAIEWQDVGHGPVARNPRPVREAPAKMVRTWAELVGASPQGEARVDTRRGLPKIGWGAR
jgi:hypothetical protein